MVIFPASYTEVDVRPREAVSDPSKKKQEEEDTKVGLKQIAH